MLNCLENSSLVCFWKIKNKQNHNPLFKDKKLGIAVFFMRLVISPPFQCCTNAICSKLYKVFFSFLVSVSVSSDDISITFLWKLHHRMNQITQLENSSFHQSTIYFPLFNWYSITPNNILPLFRRSYKKKKSLLCTVHPRNHTDYCAYCFRLRSYHLFLLGMT